LKKKKKRKKKKKKSVPKQMSWRDYSSNPKPYEIPLYTPPYPSVINIQKNQPNVQRILADALRNYQAINTVELERLRGDLTAYRIESQTNFKQKVLAPKRGPNEERFLSFKEKLRREPKKTEEESVDSYSLPGQSIQSLFSFPRAESDDSLPLPLQRTFSDESNISDITEASEPLRLRKERKQRTSKIKTKKELIRELNEMGIKAKISNTSKQIRDVAIANNIEIKKMESIDEEPELGPLSQPPPLKRTSSAKEFLAKRDARREAEEFNTTIIEPPKQLNLFEVREKFKIAKAKKATDEARQNITDDIPLTTDEFNTTIPREAEEFNNKIIEPDDDESVFGMSVLG